MESLTELQKARLMGLFLDNALSQPRDDGGQTGDFVSTPPSLDKKYAQTSFRVPATTHRQLELYSLFRNSYANAIFKDYETLRAIMDRHEALIRRRWKKKSHSERKKWLKKTWPHIPINHRPDLIERRLVYDCIKINDPHGVGERTESYMWPDLNLEDLALPEPLPLMLSARSSAHDPSCFADTDFDTCIFPAWKEMIEGYRGLSEQAANSFSVFRTQQTASTYGEIKQCDTRCTHKGLAPCRVGYPVGDGVMLLQVQARIYNFLVEVCKTILHDKDTSELTGSHIPVVPRPPEDNKVLTSLGSLKAAAIRAPYRVPANMEMDRMLEAVSAKVDAAEDHLHSMREDPTYFADALQEYEAHDVRWLYKRVGRHERDEAYEKGRITTSFPAAYALFWPKAWSKVLQKLQTLAASLSRDKCKVDEDLPPEVGAAYKDVVRYLQDMEILMGSILKDVFISTPCVRTFFRGWLPVGEWWDQRLDDPIVGEPGFQYTRRILLAIEKLDDPIHCQRRKPHNLVEELDVLRIVTNEVMEEPLIDSYVAALISDIAIVAECRRQLALFQPWARHYHLIWEHPTEGIICPVWDEDIDHVLSCIDPTDPTFPGFLDEKTASHVLPAGKKLYYPIQQQEAERDRATVKSLQRAENNLDNF
ncbi:hypothetical protein PG987_012625 [Apiospora arundinis]